MIHTLQFEHGIYTRAVLHTATKLLVTDSDDFLGRLTRVGRTWNKTRTGFSEISSGCYRRDHMSDDEQRIRELVERWMSATKAGDVRTVLTLMADDVIFMVPGQEPFGKDIFAENSRKLANAQIDGISDIQEIHVLGSWAWMRNFLEVTITSSGGETAKRSGYTLTLLRKQSDGSWVIFRDANLLAPGSRANE